MTEQPTAELKLGDVIVEKGTIQKVFVAHHKGVQIFMYPNGMFTASMEEENGEIKTLSAKTLEDVADMIDRRQAVKIKARKVKLPVIYWRPATKASWGSKETPASIEATAITGINRTTMKLSTSPKIDESTHSHTDLFVDLPEVRATLYRIEEVEKELSELKSKLFKARVDKPAWVGSFRSNSTLDTIEGYERAMTELEEIHTTALARFQVKPDAD